jgi:hypothetical protein
MEILKSIKKSGAIRNTFKLQLLQLLIWKIFIFMKLNIAMIAIFNFKKLSQNNDDYWKIRSYSMLQTIQGNRKE